MVHITCPARIGRNTVVQFGKTLQCFVRLFSLSVLFIVVGARIIDDFKDKLSNT